MGLLQSAQWLPTSVSPGTKVDPPSVNVYEGMQPLGKAGAGPIFDEAGWLLLTGELVNGAPGKLPAIVIATAEANVMSNAIRSAEAAKKELFGLFFMGGLARKLRR